MLAVRRLSLVVGVFLLFACESATCPSGDTVRSADGVCVCRPGTTWDFDRGICVAAPDAGPAVCVVDRDCQDGTYCNGEERCMPGATDADPLGCVAAFEPACRTGYTCGETERRCVPDCGRAPDADGDGHAALDCGGDDCDDDDANRFPGNIEVCDAADHDEDCNPETFGFVDADGDGSGVDSCCNVDGDTRYCGDDCNDADTNVNPRAAEACDRIDNNCDGIADESCPCMPGTAEVCGMATGACQEGRRLCVDGILGECVGEVGPAEEICNGLDDDCDGMTDEHVLRTYYADTDGDGYGVPDMTTEACSVPDGWASNTADCDDARATRNPGSLETCNGLDDDCDEMTDEGLLRPFYTDADGDGFGADATRAASCSPGATQVERGGDCNDTSRAISPVGIEVCNGVNDDCDASTDEGALRTFYRDQDMDGAGGTTTMMACTAPSGYVAAGGDCADMDPLRYPGRYEACNGIDDDCVGGIDPGCACTDGTRRACGTGPGGGAATDEGECAIGSQICVGGAWGACVGDIGPAAEVCNGRDDDCDGTVDDGVTASGCYVDGDGDGYGIGSATTTCRDAARGSLGFCAVGYANRGGDCNDTAGSVRPMTAETCDGVDQNCDGMVDNGTGMICALGSVRAGTGAFGSCASVAGTYTCNAGCTSETFTPAPPAESCNGMDDDCDGAADEPFECRRGATGYACVTGCGTVGTRSCSTSCSFTGQTCAGTEICNGCDDDADSMIDDGFTCRYGQTRSASHVCGGTGTQTCLSDCSGWGAALRTETCDGCDEDGDGVADNGFTCPRGDVRLCTTSCGTPGQQVCNASCSAYPTCTAITEYCNYCDDDGDGTTADERGLASGYVETEAVCSDLSFFSTAETCSVFAIGTQQIAIVNQGFSDAGAIWQAPLTMGYGTYRLLADMIVSKTSSAYLPADGWATILSDGGSGDVGGIGGALGVPMTRTGLAIEWRFYSTDPNTDQVDVITVRRLTGSGSGTVLATASVATAYDFGSGDTTLTQRLLISYTPDDPTTLFDDERLQVWAGSTTGSPLISLTGIGDPSGVLTREFTAGNPIRTGFTAGTGGRTFTGRLRVQRSFLTDPLNTYTARTDVCL